MGALWRSQANRLSSIAVEVCWRPAQGDASGDFHDVVDLADGRIAVFLGDAPAFGPRAAELADELRFFLRRAIRTERDGAAALGALDDHLADRGTDTIATAVCAVLHPAERRLEVTNAGHLPILVATATGARFLDERADPPLGVKARRQPVGYQLTADASVFFLTDGLVERRGASIDDGLGAALEEARQLTGGSAGAAELARRVTERLGQPEDDATVVSVRLLPAQAARDNTHRVSLRLFVDPADIRSARAERVARELARTMGGLVPFDLEVIDITVSADAAEEEGVMAAPTVVRLLPAPQMRVVGNVRSPGELARALQLPYAEEIDL